MASSHRKKTVGERKTAKSSPPGDGEVKGRKRCVTHSSLNIRTSSSSASKGQVANSRPEPESIYPGSTGAVPGAYNARPHEPRTPMPRAPRPQEPGRSRPPVATTRAPRPDPMIAPMVQNVPPHRDPMVTPAMRNVHSHLAERPAGRNLPNEPPIGSISKRLDDMLSTPFCSHITHYEPPRDSSIRGTVLVLCSTQAEYQHPPEHKNERQRILEGICETIWPSRTPNRGLQHGCCPTDLQRSICPGTPFFESLAKKPPTTMDDLFRRANKYSMLEDDVRAATQQVLVAGRASRDNADRHAKPPDRPKPVDRRQDGPSRPDRPPITPLSVSYEKLLPMIQGLSDFRWPRPLETDPSIRDRSKKCAFHKDHGHTTETCRSLQAPVAPKAVINYINGGPSDEEYDSRRKRQKLLRAASIRERINSIRPGLTGEGPRPIDGTIIFPPAVQPIWCKHQSLAIWDIVSRVSKTPDESYPDSTVINTSLGDIILPVKLAQSLSTCNSQWYKSYHPSMSSWTHMASLHESHPFHISSNGEFPHQRRAN
ncbi:hypothetical protein CK203_015521 [Vitis vinifera]|uniref:Uncharacterized protein n=1 Tax=Vitis vinifera TaxID=29760 RepID=A0A438J5G0_VITVI|nr:hypothetical protein CK203_015521 [Vitis vinifera]